MNVKSFPAGGRGHDPSVIPVIISQPPKPTQRAGLLESGGRMLSIPWPAVCAQLRKRSVALVTKDELKQLQDLADEFKTTVDKLNAVVLANTFERWQQHVADLCKTQTDPFGGDAWTRKDWKEDAEQRRQFLSKQLRLITAQCLPIVEAVCGRLETALIKAADEQKASEADAFATWGVNYVPSHLFIMLSQASWRCKAELVSPGMNPATIISILKG
jgi:hypothetical protein